MQRWNDVETRLSTLASEANAIQARCDAERRDTTTEEAAQLDALFAEFNKLSPEKPDTAYYARLRLGVALARGGDPSRSRGRRTR